MLDYKSLCTAVAICVALVNTQTALSFRPAELKHSRDSTAEWLQCCVFLPDVASVAGSLGVTDALLKQILDGLMQPVSSDARDRKLHFVMGTHRHVQGGTFPPPQKCCKVFLYINSYSKMLSIRNIYASFSRPLVGVYCDLSYSK